MATLLLAQFGVYALAWGVGLALLRDERPAIAWWFACCVLQAAGLWLMQQQPADVGGLWPPASMVLLVAYGAAVMGIDQFVHGRLRHARLWLALLLPGVGWQALAWAGGLPLAGRALGHNLCVAALLLVPMMSVRRALQSEFGRWGVLPLLPGSLVCALALVRSLMIAADPSALDAAAGRPLAEQPGLLLATLLATGAFNISFIGLVLARLVVRLHQQLDTDMLCSLANRQGLERQLEAAWKTSLRYGTELSVAFIDIDRFKQINDSGGHEAGDRVLREVAELLRQNARVSDLAGRWGGDEFMLVMPHTDAAAAAQAMVRLRARVAAAHIALPPGCPALTLSIGTATRQAGDGSVQDLFGRADAGMYRIKRDAAMPAPA